MGGTDAGVEEAVEGIVLLRFEGDTGLLILALCGGFVCAGGADRAGAGAPSALTGTATAVACLNACPDDSSTGSGLILTRGKNSSPIFILLKVALVISSPVVYRAKRLRLRLFSMSRSLKILEKIIGYGME